MKKTIFTFLILIILSSCGQKFEFWELSKFNLSNNALADNEEVRIIYYYAGPFDTQVDEGFYRHAIVVSLMSKDTFNVLTFPTPSLYKLSKENNRFVYNDHPVIDKAIPKIDDFPKEVKEKLLNDSIHEVSWAKYKRVARDPHFDYLADNNYKTVIGTLSQ